MSELFQPSMQPWTRRRADAVLVGVCAALARATGAPALAVRLVFSMGGSLFLAITPVAWSLELDPSETFTLAGLAGSTLIVYLLCWFALPSDTVEHRTMLGDLSVASVRGKPRLRETSTPTQHAANRPILAFARWLILASLIGVSVTVGVLAILSLSGADYGPWILFGIGAGTVAGGGALGLLPLSLVDDARWSGHMNTLPRVSLAGVVGSALLLLGGALIMVRAIYGIKAVAITGAIVLLALGLMSIVLVPWIRRLWSGIKEESEQRALVRHQAEITAHLHDSVLQTLTVIQREGTSADLARNLARQQEVALRRWLYGNVSASFLGPEALNDVEDDLPSSFTEAIETVCARLEQQHGTDIEVVTVGSAPMTPTLLPLVRATREAGSNAVRHGKVGVQVFVDASARPIEVFVRDRGPGFDLASLPDGRLGVRESIVGRMERAGGTARLSPAVGGGMEVALTLDPDSRGMS